MESVERRSGAEIVILTVLTTAPLEPADYAVRVFERWRIGKKGRDNGVLFLVATRDRRTWITVGYGLESVLPDSKVAEIRDDAVLPLFRQGRLAAGILEGTKRIAASIQAVEPDLGSGRSPPPALDAPGLTSRESTESGPALVVAIRFLLLLILLGLGMEILVRLSGGRVLALNRPRSLVYGFMLAAGIVVVATPLAALAYLVVLPAVLLARGFAEWRRSRRQAGDSDDWGHRGSYSWPGEFSSGSFGGFGGGATGGGGGGGLWDVIEGSDVDSD